jgi:adenine-specific DNA-methyltransferase
MNHKKQKLELTWVGKGEESKLEPRILIEDSDQSYGDPNTENMLIYGDNLLALKALEQDFTGKIKCIYIDPPYNTGNAFEHYDDGLEHSQWLNLMKPRLEILRRLLSNDGSLWISIDDDESHYLKVLCDEVFGRSNFVANVIWQKKYAPSNDAKWLSDSHDHILVYAKYKDAWRPNLLPRTDKQNQYYKYDDNDGRGLWRSDNVLVKSFSQSGVFPIINPLTNKEHWPPKGSCYRFNQDTAKYLIADNRLYFGKDGQGAPQLKRYLSEVKQGLTALTVWLREEVDDNQEAKKEVKAFNDEEVFATPKPERLIQRILTLGSNEGDLVLDSFLGSGTTSAVAHKMNRRWIGIELGEHCLTHCVPRLQKVINGEDQGGISKSVNWQGGGGFKFYNLAPSLLKKDRFDNWVINPEYNPDMLAAAMAKHEGFKYNPSQEIYWKQGQSTEKDYIFTTTQFITMPLLDSIHEEIAEDESLLICCKAFTKACSSKYPNITIRKIPKVVLGKCEFDNDDYSLNIVRAPIEKSDDTELEVALGEDLEPQSPKKKKDQKENPKSTKRQTRKSLQDVNQLSIFH